MVVPLPIGKNFRRHSLSTVRLPRLLPQPRNLAQVHLISDGKMTREDLAPQRPSEPDSEVIILNLRPGVYFVSERDLGEVRRRNSLRCKPPWEFRTEDPVLTEGELELTNAEPSEPEKDNFDGYDSLAYRDINSELPSYRPDRGRRR
jgi:hypothetical protein